MRTTLLLFIAILAAHLFAQNWSDPVNVSNMPGHDSYADFCIDANGVIHVVWEHEIQPARVTKIMYSKSIDDGLTWSVPVVISEDIEDLMGYPRIVVDSQNNLHVTYYYHNWVNNQLHYRKCTNQIWGDFIDVVPGHCRVYNCELVVDNNDRVYMFWVLLSYNEFQYRYIDGDGWSPIIAPFSAHPEYGYLVTATVDTNNNLHAIGSFSDDGAPFLISYFYYDSAADIWQTPVELGEILWGWGYDIALDFQNNPHLIWREYISGVPNYEMTKYSYFNGQYWSEPEVVTEFGRWQTMVIDRSGTKHVVESKKFVIDQYNSVWDLVYYSGDDWDNGEILTNSGYIATLPRLIIRNGTLYLLYLLNPASSSVATDVYFMKKQLVSDISDPVSNVPSTIQLHQNTPNPFQQQTQINYSLKMGGYTNMRIYNTKGQLVKNLVNDSKKAGNHSATWDGTDDLNQPVASGIYLCRLEVGDKVVSKLITLIR